MGAQEYIRAGGRRVSQALKTAPICRREWLPSLQM